MPRDGQRPEDFQVIYGVLDLNWYMRNPLGTSIQLAAQVKGQRRDIGLSGRAFLEEPRTEPGDKGAKNHQVTAKAIWSVDGDSGPSTVQGGEGNVIWVRTIAGSGSPSEAQSIPGVPVRWTQATVPAEGGQAER